MQETQNIGTMSETSSSKKTHPLWQRLLFSDLLLGGSRAKAVAWIGVMTALCIVTNIFELKFATIQFSFTVFTSILAGIVLGPLPGFCAVFLGDGIGYLVNSMGYFYYWWVALSVAMTAAVAGLVMCIPIKCRGSIFIKLALISVLTFFLCSVGINSTGMYYIGLKIFFPANVSEMVASRFGGRFDFGIYLVIRYFFLFQIVNSAVNYALLFAAVPALNAIRPLNVHFD